MTAHRAVATTLPAADFFNAPLDLLFPGSLGLSGTGVQIFGKVANQPANLLGRPSRVSSTICSHCQRHRAIACSSILIRAINSSNTKGRAISTYRRQLRGMISAGALDSH